MEQKKFYNYCGTKDVYIFWFNKIINYLKETMESIVLIFNQLLFYMFVTLT